MRIWSLHPKYLDRQGLVACWREALLAKAVLRGETRGYQRHPQLERFQAERDPIAAIDLFLHGLFDESLRRNYRFDKSKIGTPIEELTISVTSGQLEYEWTHLRRKLAVRSPEWLEHREIAQFPVAHPIFVVRAGPVESWERPVA